MIKFNIAIISALMIGALTTNAAVAQTGTASWYGNQFHGKRTASGSIYNQWGMTAAHRKLPFGSKVKVTNIANGKTAILKITDRGPFTRGRVIDISRKANGILDCNLCKVSIKVLSRGDGKYRKE